MEKNPAYLPRLSDKRLRLLLEAMGTEHFSLHECSSIASLISSLNLELFSPFVQKEINGILVRKFLNINVSNTVRSIRAICVLKTSADSV